MPKPHPRRVTRAAAWHRALPSAASTHQHTGMQHQQPPPFPALPPGRRGVKRGEKHGAGNRRHGYGARGPLAPRLASGRSPPQAPGEKAGGSCDGWQCKEHAGPLRRGVQQWEREENASLPPVNTALRGARSLLPFGEVQPGHEAGSREPPPALAGGQGSLLVPGEQEAVEEVDGTLAVLLGLLRQQVGWRPQEEAGEQGGDHGGGDVVVVRVFEQLSEERH